MTVEKNNQAKLTQGPIGKILFEMTVPMFWGLFAVIAFNLVDTYFVGQLGTQELAAISFTFPVVMFIGSIAMGLGIGASSVISRAIGEGDINKVRRLATDSLSLALIVVAIFVLIGLVTIEPLFIALGAEPVLLPLIKSYMLIWYGGVIFLIVPMVGNNVLRATGDTKYPAIIMTIGGVVNAILDPLLIFGWLGFPRLELQGAAIATVISRALTLIASLMILHYREKMLIFAKTKSSIIFQSWKEILKIGFPSAASNLIMPISMGVITAMVAKYGAHAVAALGIVTRIEAFALMVFMALASVLGPFVGQNWGAKNKQRVLSAVNMSNRFVFIWGCTVAGLLLLLHIPIIHLFNKQFEVVRVASVFLCLVPWSYGFEGIRFNTSATFNAIGRPLYPIALTFTRMILLCIPLAMLGSQLFGINGIIAAAFFANIITGLLSLFWNKKIVHKQVPTVITNQPITQESGL